MAAQTHAQDLATQDRLTKNVKDILWLNTYAAGPNVSPSAALAALKVRGLLLLALTELESQQLRETLPVMLQCFHWLHSVAPIQT